MYQSKIKVKLTDIVDIETEEDPRHMSREGLQEIITENLADKISLYDHDDLKGIIDSTNILETKTDATEYEGSA